MDLIQDVERAGRLARAILSDVMIYNRDKVRRGIEADDLFARLHEDLERARAFFATRVDPELLRKSNLFDRAIVDVVVYRSRDVASRIW
jgi:hypothetical protein